MWRSLTFPRKPHLKILFNFPSECYPMWSCMPDSLDICIASVHILHTFYIAKTQRSRDDFISQVRQLYCKVEELNKNEWVLEMKNKTIFLGLYS